MSIDQERINLLDILLKPREDYFALENVQPLLPPLIDYLAKIGCKEWDKEALHELADALRTDGTLLASSTTGGIKGIYGSHPMHGALLKIAECSADEIYKRLYLLAHVIDVAYQWREDIQHAGPHNTFLPSDEKRLTYNTYLENLETACKVVRKLDAEWLDEIAEGHDSSEDLQQQLHRFSVDPEILDDSYIQQLERFLAYGLHSRGPRKGHSKGGGTAKKKP